MLLFKSGDLFAERRLADSQYLGSSREVSLFSQDHDGMLVTHINVGEPWLCPHGALDWLKTGILF
jgi:hypothetical protein